MSHLSEGPPCALCGKPMIPGWASMEGAISMAGPGRYCYGDHDHTEFDAVSDVPKSDAEKLAEALDKVATAFEEAFHPLAAFLERYAVKPLAGITAAAEGFWDEMRRR